MYKNDLLPKAQPKTDAKETGPAQSISLRVMGQGFGLAWCWQDKKIRRGIREKLNAGAANALLTYDSMTEILSDIGKEIPFQIPHSIIASMAGRSVSAVKLSLEDLRHLGYLMIWKLAGPKVADIYAIPGITLPDPLILTGSPLEYAALQNGRWIIVKAWQPPTATGELSTVTGQLSTVTGQPSIARGRENQDLTISEEGMNKGKGGVNKNVYHKENALSEGVQGGNDAFAMNHRLKKFPTWLQREVPDFPELLGLENFDEKPLWYRKVVENIGLVKVGNKLARTIFIENCNEQREQIKLERLGRRDKIEDRAKLFFDRWGRDTKGLFQNHRSPRKSDGNRPEHLTAKVEFDSKTDKFVSPA